MTDRSVPDVASELGVSRPWLYAKCAASEVEHQRYGRAVRFTEAQVQSLRERFRQPAVSSRRLGRAS